VRNFVREGVRTCVDDFLDGRRTIIYEYSDLVALCHEAVRETNHWRKVMADIENTRLRTDEERRKSEERERQAKLVEQHYIARAAGREPPSPDDTVTIREGAELLRLKQRQVWYWVAARRLRTWGEEKCLRVSINELAGCAYEFGPEDWIEPEYELADAEAGPLDEIIPQAHPVRGIISTFRLRNSTHFSVRDAAALLGISI